MFSNACNMCKVFVLIISFCDEHKPNREISWKVASELNIKQTTYKFLSSINFALAIKETTSHYICGY